jgi:Calx-beta domain
MKTAAGCGIAVLLAVCAHGQGPATLQFEQPSLRVNRASRSALLAVTRKGPGNDEAVVSYNTRPGTAAAGPDYATVADKLTFASGEMRKTFTIPIFAGNSTGDVSFLVELSNPQNATLGSPATALLTLAPGRVLSPVTLRVIKHVSLVLVTLALFLLITWLAVRQARGRSKMWTRDFLLDKSEALQFPADSPIPPLQQERLKKQLEEVGNRIEHHTDVMAFFYGAYYSSIMCFSLAAAMAAVMAVLVSKGGWQVSNEYIVNLFFTTTLAAAFFGSSPAVFQHQLNIGDNKVFAMKYLALKNEILTFAVTSEGLKYDSQNPLPIVTGTGAAPDPKTRVGIPLPPSEFLHYVDLQLSRDNVAIGFDVNKVADYKGALEVK